MAEKPSGERTEKATPRKLKKARREGHIAHSSELGSWLSVLAASFVLPTVARSLMADSQRTMFGISSIIDHPDVGQALGLARTATFDGARALAPLAALVILAAVGSAVLQGGARPAPKLLLPKFSRVNPLNGVKRMFGPQGLWALVKSLAKVAVLGGVTYAAVRHLIPSLMGSGALPLAAVLHTTVGAALSVIRYGAAAGVVLALADVAVVRRRNNKHLKMSKQEVKEEMKQSDGDPQLRAAIRARALQISRNRMMLDAAGADVVVVNPTHVAVALQYDPANGAPRVVAKGADEVAARLREIAEKNRIPMIADIPLARTLFAACDVGAEIPSEMYQAVATVLAFVMRLKKRGSAAGTHRLSAARA